ncbi:MAG: hypothetical protein AB7W16_17135 [Candidatus Obscuribacterales bacterium]
MNNPDDKKSLDTKCGTTVSQEREEDQWVQTPGGLKHRENVHQIGPCSVLCITEDRYQALDHSGALVEDFGPRAMARDTQPPLLSPQQASGAVITTFWKNTTGNPITSYTAQWTVPPEPRNVSDQILYLFNGLIDDKQEWILQPVLCFGTSPDLPGTGDFWTISSWFVNALDGRAFKSAAQRVNPGDVLTGVMSQDVDMSTSPPTIKGYGCIFQGYPVTCLLVQNLSSMPELVIANTELEAYKVTLCPNFPFAAKVRMQAIEIKSGETQLPVHWSTTNSDAGCGQEAEVVLQGSPGGIVDLWINQPSKPDPPLIFNLFVGQGLRVGESLTCPNGRLSMTLQDDGNLVIYTPGKYPLWASNSNGQTGVWDLVMQPDGNLVAYDIASQPFWASDSITHVESYFSLHDSGSGAIYEKNTDKVLWSTNTSVPAHPLKLPGTTGYLKTGEGILAGQSIASAGDLFTLKLQTDGNLVLYAPGEQPIWASDTSGHPDVWDLVMQEDGNLVIYNTEGKPLWASDTAGHTGAVLEVQDDGNLVIYDSKGVAYWATGSNSPPLPARPTKRSRLNAGQGIINGDYLMSDNGLFKLTLQQDGNMVLTGYAGQPYWASNTVGNSMWDLIMQPDGNLVAYDVKGKAPWASGTVGITGGYLSLQDDGNAVVYDSGKKPHWASNTVVPASPAAPSEAWILRAGQGVLAGQSLVSENGLYSLTLQGDGNLVLKGPQPCRQVLWSTNTSNDQVWDLILQNDGNLVVYDRNSNPIWATNTPGHPNARLLLDPRAQFILTLYDRFDTVLWHS